MSRMLINAIQPDEVRIAVTRNRQLIDLEIEQSAYKQKKSNIYKGVITSIEPSLGAVFVDYGAKRHGFLPIKEISKEYFLREHPDAQKNYDISSIDPNKILKLGQQLVVQIEKEERGTKGAALTTFISLPGSFLVLMPNSPRAGGISRRIEGEDREQLKETVKGLNTPDGMGIIIRTACVGKTTEELNWDLDILLRYWEAIKQAAIVKPGPYLIHQESDVIIRSIRDYLRHDIEEIIIDEENAYKKALHYLNQIRPEFIERLKFYTDALPIFSRFQIEQQIEQAYQKEVQLPSGGSLVIDHTEALVAIDINSARATKGSSIEETAYNTNLEAAEEIAKQMRIRDIGGLIVIDFIDMLQSSHQREVENRLRQSLRLDRARIQIGRISRFGMLEMSRQRLRSALVKNTQDICPRCQGRGTIRSVESLTLSMIHLIEEQAINAGNAHLQVQLPIDVTTYLMNEKRQLLNAIQTRTQVNIVVIPNHHLSSPAYQIKLIKDDHGKGAASYKQVKVPKAEQSIRKNTKIEELDQPAINEFLTQMPAAGTPPTASHSEGFLKKLWEIMFGGTETGTASPDKKMKAAKMPSKPTSQKKPQRNEEKTSPSQTKECEKNPANSTARRSNRGGQQQKTPSNRTQNSANTQRPKKQPTRPSAQQKNQTPPNKNPQKRTTGGETKTTFQEKNLKQQNPAQEHLEKNESEKISKPVPKQPEAIHNTKPSSDPVANETTVFDHSQANQVKTKNSKPSPIIPDYQKPDLPAYQRVGSEKTPSALQQVTTKKKATVDNNQNNKKTVIATPTEDKDAKNKPEKTQVKDKDLTAKPPEDKDAKNKPEKTQVKDKDVITTPSEDKDAKNKPEKTQVKDKDVITTPSENKDTKE